MTRRSLTVDEEQWRACNAQKWDELAALWRTQGVRSVEDAQGLAADLACNPGSLFIDVGCGAGLWSIALARDGYRVLGIDASSRMIWEARQLADQYGFSQDILRFEVGDAEHIDMPDASADGIFCRAVLDFVPSPGAALTEAWRVLKPGHRLVLSVLGARSPVKYEAWRRFLPGAKSVIGMNQILPWETEALLGELKWKILRHRPLFGPAANGATNEYTLEQAERLDDRILQQAIATAWEFVAAKPSDAQ